MAWLLAATCSACGSALGPALDDLSAGRHPEAAARLEALEPDADRWEPGERARYALYRGLAHLALGDAVDADRYLSEAHRAVTADPSLLDGAEHGRLLAAWRAVGRMPGETGR